MVSWQVICPSGSFTAGLSRPFRKKNSAFAVGQISFKSPPVPRHQRGAFRDRHDTLARDAVDALGAQTMRIASVRSSRVVVVRRRWDQVRGDDPRATEASKPGTPARARSKP